MKLFVTLLHHCAALGIYPVNSVSKHSFNLKSCSTLLLIMQLSIPPFIYLIIDAKTVDEYADAFYIFATGTSNGLNVLLVIWNVANGLHLIENFEDAIQKRRLQTIYNKLNTKIEKFSKRFYWLLVQCTLVGVMMPTFFITYFVYFTTDLGCDAFQLPFLAW